MNILQIVTYYKNSQVFNKQFSVLQENYNVKQTIFCPKRLSSKLKDDKYILFNKFTKIDSIMYYPRIIRAFRYIDKKIDLKNINIVHAHSVFADGGIAWIIKKKYNIDYVVSVRADTINYLKKLPHVYLIFKKILLDAKMIIYISPYMKEFIDKKLNTTEKNILNKKSILIPNGIDSYWLNNCETKTKSAMERINFVQVSSFLKRKNLGTTIRFIKYLNDNKIKCNLTVVGDGKGKNRYTNLVKKIHGEFCVNFKGRINDKDQLKEIYNKSDIFILPSVKETFGLVYCEAMSQGLPVIYKKGTGIDGLFKEYEVGFGIDKINDYESMKENLEIIINNYDEMSKKCSQLSKQYNWDILCEKIYQIYVK